MANLSITYPNFIAGTVISSTEVDTNNSDIQTYINNRNSGTTAWDQVKSTAQIQAHVTTEQLLLGNPAGNYTVITSPAPSAARTYTIPDAGGSASFVMTAGAQTISGATTFADQKLLLQETGGTDVVTINVASLGASRAYTVPDAGAAASFIMTAGAQTISGAKTFANQTLLLQETGSTDVVTINVASLAAGRAYTLPDAGGSATFAFIDAVQTFTARQQNSAQPCFSVQNSSDRTDVTGDGTDYTVVFDTEIFDQASNFASNTFTAPATGKYMLNAYGILSGLLSGHTSIQWRIVTSNRTYEAYYQLGTYGYGRVTPHLSVVADMDVNDTATVHCIVSGGTKVVDILGTGSSTFSGYLAA